jgi:Raf kinase inhibitor-like YbhB/YbcL family protein
MGLAHQVGRNIGRVMAAFRAGDDKLFAHRVSIAAARTLDVTSPAFTDGGMLPLAYTADGASGAPRIEWSNLPPGTKSIAVVLEDPDAPYGRPFVHWLVYDLPPTENALDGPPAYGREGKNSMLEIGYKAAAPPAGHGLHHYHFQVFALSTALGLDDGAGRSALLEAMQGHVIAWGEIVATYERS